MLIKEFCKSLLNKGLEEAKLEVKNIGLRSRDFTWKENFILPEIKNEKTIILRIFKDKVVDAFPYNPLFIEI